MSSMDLHKGVLLQGAGDNNAVIKQEKVPLDGEGISGLPIQTQGFLVSGFLGPPCFAVLKCQGTHWILGLGLTVHIHLFAR